MKEVKEWNNVPREMWVWDNKDMSDRRKAFVVFVDTNPDLEDGYSGVCTIKKQQFHEAYTSEWFKHCAEIEQRLMTNKELARWLREKPDREYKKCINCMTDTWVISGYHDYAESAEDVTIDSGIYIRENDCPWFVPFTDK